MPDARLPELARSLRSLGASGGACLSEAHEAIFGPLLDARAEAARASGDAAIDAMNGHAILKRIEKQVATAATRDVKHPAQARALAARAREAIDPLERALLALDELAVLARSEEGWQGWIDQLRRIFTTADDACRMLAKVLGERASAT